MRSISGIGNAYSDEILHRAGLSPVKMSDRLSDEEHERLFEKTREVLGEQARTLEWNASAQPSGERSVPTIISSAKRRRNRFCFSS